MPSRPLTRVAMRKAANFIFSSKNKNMSTEPWKVDADKGKDRCCNDGMRQDKPIDVLLHLVYAIHLVSLGEQPIHKGNSRIFAKEMMFIFTFSIWSTSMLPTDMPTRLETPI